MAEGDHTRDQQNRKSRADSDSYITRVRTSTPPAMQESPGWCLWRNEDGRKVPYYATGRRRGADLQLDSPEDRKQLVTFEKAVLAFQAGHYTGLGFALGRYQTNGKSVVVSGIDLDNISEDDDRVQRILLASSSYAEISPSGKGLKIFGLGDIGNRGKQKDGHLEYYSHGRFFTVTGRMVSGNTLEDLTEAVELARKLFGEKKASQAKPSAEAELSPSQVKWILDSSRIDVESYEPWIQTGQAIKSAYSDEGFKWWRDWSWTSIIWTEPEEALRAKWRSFKGEGLTTRKLMYLADLKGGELPAPTVEEEGFEKIERVKKQPLTGISKGMTLAEFQHKEIKHRQAIYEGLLFPGAYLFTGPGKLGKTLFLIQWSIAFSRRESFLGCTCARQEGDLLGIFLEDPEDQFQERLKNFIGENNPWPTNFRFVDQKEFKRWAKKYAKDVTFEVFLAAYLDENPNVKWVVIDTEVAIRLLWNNIGGREEKKIMPVVERDYDLARRYEVITLKRDVAIFLVNHTGKRKKEWFDAHELINRTASAIAGCSGSFVLYDLPDTDPLMEDTGERIFAIKGRRLKDHPILLVRQVPAEEGGYGNFEYKGTYYQIMQTDAEQEILEQLEVLQFQDYEGHKKGEPVRAKDIAKYLGKTSRNAAFNVRRTLSYMRRKGKTRWNDYLVKTVMGPEGGYLLEPDFMSL